MSFIAVSAVNEKEHITCFGRGETPEEAFNALNIAESNETWEDDEESVNEATSNGYIEINVYTEHPANIENTLTTYETERLLEKIADNAYDIVGEVSENYLRTDKITKEAIEELRSQLVCIVEGWMEHHKLNQKLFSLDKLVETRKVPYPLDRCCNQQPEVKERCHKSVAKEVQEAIQKVEIPSNALWMSNRNE